MDAVTGGAADLAMQAKTAGARPAVFVCAGGLLPQQGGREGLEGRVEGLAVAADGLDPGPLGEDVWLVTVNKELGTVRAKQESGDQLEWSLVRTDVEVKVGNAKLLCHDYDFKCDPPVELKALVIQKRRMCLSAEVPGRVVRQSYSGFLGATWKVDLISFRR